MELKGITMPGYKVYEYMLVLNPHEELRTRITEVRKEFGKEYKLTSGTGGKPNLPLVHFVNYEMMEERIINRLKTIALGFPPFKVELKNFGSFPTHTIYINVISKIPIQGLVKEIRTQTQRLMTINEETKPYFILEPHITIGRKLKPWQYEKGWLEYSNKHFAGRFIGDAMLLLKRDSKETPWMIVERFQFQNMPVTTKQGELFG
jgi:2'-5' RNA ligase